MRLVAAIILLVSTSGMATTWNCPVIDSTKPAAWPDERVVAEFTETTVQTISYIHQIHNADGTFTEQSEILFSVPQHLRGGFSVAFCESDTGHVALQYGMVNMVSKCATTDHQNPLDFRADLRTGQNGSLSTQIQELQNGNDIDRSISVSACK